MERPVDERRSLLLQMLRRIILYDILVVRTWDGDSGSGTGLGDDSMLSRSLPVPLLRTCAFASKASGTLSKGVTFVGV